MKSLLDYILENRRVYFGIHNPNYNQCVILAGGAASGKGNIQKLIDITGKVFDVDELKKKYIKLAKADILPDTYDYDLAKPEDCARLHQIIKDKGWKGKERSNFFKGNSNPEHLGNVIFDMVSDNYEDIEDVVCQAKGSGYTVTIVWVVTPIGVAITNNAIRGIGDKSKRRSVPDYVLKSGHAGAYSTICDILNNKYKVINEFIDNVWIGFGNGWGYVEDPIAASSPVIRIKKDNDNNFIFNQEQIDSYLNTMPQINYDKLNRALTSSKPYEKEQAEMFIKLTSGIDKSKLR